MQNFFEFVRPHAALREYFRLYHVFRLGIQGGGPGAAVKAVWPSRYGWLAFSPFDNSLVESHCDGLGRPEPRAALLGLSTRMARKWYSGPEWFRFQVQLQPGALFRLTGIPNAELTDGELDAEAVLGPGARAVNDRLAEAASLGQMVAIVEEFLFTWVGQCSRTLRPLDRAIDRMAHDPSFASLDAAASLACLSHKQFYRKFVERMGVGPKTYLRVVRLARAFGCKARQPDLAWTVVAHAVGYYDYQHMVRDFRLMAHDLPVQAFDRERRSPEARYGFSSERIW